MSKHRTLAPRLRLAEPALLFFAFLLLTAATAQAAAPVPPELLYPSARGETATPRPWEIDAATAEAPLKAAAQARLAARSEEPTAAQLALDARAYDLSLTLDPDAHTIAGTLGARFTVATGPATVAELDLADELTVTGVTLGGQPAVWVHAGDHVTITLDRPYLQDETIELAVDYHGTPPASYGAFGFDSHAGQPLIWTLSEPFGARSWWPCDDWSDDKADSLDLHITVPSGLIVASNGELRETTSAGGWDTYWWHERFPIATYLVSLAIYPYTVYSDYYVHAPDDSMEVRFYIYPDHYADTYEVNMMTADIIEFYATVYGEYPFLEEKYGHAEFNWGGGMEHQTCTSLGVFYESIVAHELSHQWWGDMVTCADFHDIWLNEGFAVYSEALWLEHHYGPDGYWGKMNATRYYGDGTIYVPDLSDWNRIFDVNLTYNKASWVVHMLRHVVGDTNFFQLLADYRQAFAYGAAHTDDLQALAEAVSGLDLEDFFSQWIYGEYYPHYQYHWACVETERGYSLQLAIDQIQTNTGLFHMPLDIRVTLEGGGTEDFVVDNALAHEEYALTLSGPATAVALDPGDWVLKRVTEEVVDPTFSQGILLVNGVHWETYGSEITDAYENRAFWGTLPISFWDCFPEPVGGYPSTLPAPLGHGRIPSSTLGDYATLIWVGNDYSGDLDAWLSTAIESYLGVGGNVLLMTRRGENFLDEALRDYLGLTFGTGSSIYDCVAAHPELTDIARIGTQNYCPVFEPTFAQPSTQLLYLATLVYEPDVAIGAWRAPVGGGTHNPDGSQFAYLSGRPYRWDATDLQTNVETIVTSLFVQGASTVAPPTPVARLALRAPNPVHGAATLHFTLPRAGRVEVALYDTQGRRVRELLAGPRPAGEQALVWDGRLRGGERAPAGLYFLRLESLGQTRVAPLRMVR